MSLADDGGVGAGAPDGAQAETARRADFGHRLMPAGDPLSGATFDAIYEQTVKPELVKCEADRRNAMTLFFLALIAGAFLAYIEHLFIPLGKGGRAAVDLPVVTLVALGALGYWPLARVARTAKTDVIQALCAPMAISYEAKGKSAPAWDDFLGLNLLPRPSSTSLEDFFSGQRGDVQFELCEATLSQGSGRSRHTVFRGQLLRLTTGRRLAAKTVVLRNSGFLEAFACPAGLAKVGLEDPVFAKIFSVFGADQVEAREILTPVVMQELVDLETAYGGEKLRCGFIGSDIIIAVASGNHYEIGSMFSNLVDRSRVENIARDIEQLFKLIDRFKTL